MILISLDSDPSRDPQRAMVHYRSYSLRVFTRKAVLGPYVTSTYVEYRSRVRDLLVWPPIRLTTLDT